MTVNLRTFTDIDPQFILNPVTGDIAVKTDNRAISFSIKNLILTANGERPFNDLIGTPIKRLLFDNSNGDTLKIILKQMITQVVSNFEPRATLTQIDINDSPDNNLLRINITYRILNAVQPYSVNVTLVRTR